MDRPEYLRSILSLIINNTFQRDSTGGINVAKLGLAARRSLPDWRSLGFLKFKDVLTDLEAQSLVRTGPGDKAAFTVWGTESTPPKEVVSLQPVFTKTLQPLRREVWIAFTNPFPNGRRFMERHSGEIRMGLVQSPEPVTDWIEVLPIDQKTQRQWATEFLEESHPPDEPLLRDALAADDWYRRLPLELDRCGPFWKSRFNRGRSERVQNHVNEWKAKYDLPQGLIFASNYPPPHDRFHRSSGPYPAQPRFTRDLRRSRPDDDLRQLLMQSLTAASTEELCELLPAKYLIQVLRPDLCQFKSDIST